MSDAQTTSGDELHLTDATFDQQLQAAGDKPVFVDFYADWCGPCKAAAPAVHKIATDYKDKMIVAKVDSDESHETAVKNGVMSIPTVIIFKNGKEIDRKVGYPGEPVYRQMADKAVQAA